jgi:ABC-2 type transport system permease protein
VLQGGLLLALAPVAGIRLTAPAVVATLLVMVVVAFGLAALGLCLAWRLDSPQGFHAVMNLVLLPMWALSGAFFPGQGAPGWLAVLMRGNPLTYGLAAIRRTLYLEDPAAAGAVPALAPALGVAVVFALAAFACAVWVATRKRA